MNRPAINFDDFQLPFIFNLIDGSDDGSDDDIDDDGDDDYESDDFEYPDIEDLKEKMESIIPDSAIYLGSIEREVENWTTWRIYDEYYIIPLIDEKFDWAIFRLSWDDNWEKWRWIFDSRLTGYKENYLEAARYGLLKTWTRWKIDLNDIENTPYNDLLESL
jgi:hypothetical protein